MALALLKPMRFLPVFFAYLILFGPVLNADELKLHIIRAPEAIAWDSINGMLISSVKNSFRMAPQSSFPIGHFAVEVTCSTPNKLGVRHLLTGMSRKDSSAANRFVLTSGIGLGTLTYPFAGRLDSSAELLQDFEKMKELGRYKVMTIPTSAKRCQQMLTFLDSWIENASYTVYGGGKDVAHGEGSGCADFAERFYEIATGKKFPDSWVVTRNIPKALIGSEDHQVSLLGLLFRSKWAEENEASVPYRIPDPSIAFEIIDAGAKGGSPVSEELPAFKFKHTADARSGEIWDRIKISD